VTLFNRSGSKRAETPNSQSIPPKLSSSLPMKSFFNSLHIILLRRPRRSSKPSPMLLIWRWICFSPARPESTEENQPITNLKPRTFANTKVISKKVKDFTRRLLFLLRFISYKRNDLTTNKLSIFLSVAEVANHAKFVSSWSA